MLTVALDQGPFERHTPQEALARLDEIARRAAAGGARLLVCPEMSVPGYNIGADIQRLAEPADGPVGQRVRGIAAERGIAIVYGHPERDGEDVYNTAFLVSPAGDLLAAYRKTHLYGAMEQAHFRPGSLPVVQATFDDVRIGLLICYDIEFPEPARAHALAGTEFLVVPTALLPPEDAVAETLVPARAYENQIHVAYVDRCGREDELSYLGKTCLIAPDGTELARAGSGEELLFAAVDPSATTAARQVNTQLAERRPDLYRDLAEQP
ncbi:carbon-nitrogen hydrolase family protein [Saccharopolyspora mangrovi]|uniref:Carbon-nitrogen hydrolase family protein n=1 Tax=Saccharopolyspora mangrovi TaxID=3082379 RepID=A0ABU6A7C8_9PSEU|nr:carbon-nitrogen hydrolase family protein [Saccharopolyspora sp. S2-29]MEB3367290.1 carbon-nitrogen hydrolase family protein [Saccharopolyspora sp. S2-29]